MTRINKNTKYIMDASAVVAVACNEPHMVELPGMFLDSVITTLNLAEALTAVIKNTSVDPDIIWDGMSNFVQCHYHIDDELTYEVIKMYSLAKQYGLSFGDRYCLALGIVLQLPVYTGDRIWRQLEEPLGIKINLIR
jgi:ribonuclease VapC